ncbi:MAG: MBL fold metallo-hydrolase [Methanomassiliicoccales archaeon]
MKIIWHGHACFEIQAEKIVLLDPHDGKSLGIKAPVSRPDIVLISHDHFDHNAVRVVKGDYAVVKERGEHEIKGIRIRGIEAYHDEVRGSKRGKINLFRFEVGGAKFLHCGDLGHILGRKELEAIGEIDIAFIPVGGVFTLNGSQAKELVDIMKPKVVIPMHYRYGGLSLSIQTIDDFLKKIPQDKIIKVGNEIELTPEELPKETEYWVFSP